MRTVVTSLAFAMLLTACTQSVDDHVSDAIPHRFRAVLESPEKFELLTVACEGDELPEVVDGTVLWDRYSIVDKREIEDASVQEELVRGLYEAIALQENKAAACFEPHHGIRVTSGGTTVTILVCFMCHNFHMQPSGGNGGLYIDVGKMTKWRDEVKRLGMNEVLETSFGGPP